VIFGGLLSQGVLGLGNGTQV